jgi:hypothetical protein
MKSAMDPTDWFGVVSVRLHPKNRVLCRHGGKNACKAGWENVG